MGGGAEEAGGDGSAEACGFLVGDIQHGRHLVAVFRIKSAGGEHHVTCQVAVDEAEAFLLGVAHEERTVDLDSVHENQVFIEVAAAHVVL